MATILGIDWGAKRIGLSLADDDLGVAFPLPALVEGSADARWRALLSVIREKRVSELVVGYPFNMDGSVGFKAKEVDVFIDQLSALVDLPLQRVDERLTSHHASALARVARPKRKTPQQQIADRKTGKLDSQAATIILQDYLDSQSL